MAVQKTQSALMAKLGNRLDKAVREHAGDETTYGVQTLPPGIANGVARLIKCGFGEYKSGTYKGEPYFRASGVVLSPKTVDVDGETVPVAGIPTSIMIQLCDRKDKSGNVTKTLEEFVEDVLNEMRKLGGQDFTEGAGGGDLEGLAAALEQAAPVFKFSTSRGKVTPEYPNPRIWENWHGTKGLENWSDGGAAGGDVEDNTGATATPEKAPAKPAAPPAGRPAGKAPAKAPAPEPVEYNDQGDIDSLAEAADGGDDDAAEKLSDQAKAMGISAKQIKDADNWTALAELMKAAGGGPGSEPADDDSEYKVGSCWGYDFKNTKTKRVQTLECEIDVLNPDGTADIHSLDDPKVKFKSVPLASLKGI